jgi:hypothetical protein
MGNWENRAKKLESRARKQRHKIHNKGMANNYKDMIDKKAGILNKIDKISKDIGIVADVNTPTYGGGGSDAKRIQDRIKMILGKSIPEIHEEAKQVKPKSRVQAKILGDVEQFLDKYLDDADLVQKFLDGYKKLALLSKSFSGQEFDELLDIAKSISDKKQFDIRLPSNADRIDKVIFIDSTAHNLHKVKLEDGRSLYKQLDELASISKSIGEKNRDDRLLLLQAPTSNKSKLDSLGVHILQKSAFSVWNLYEKAIKIGVEKLSNKELVILREFLWSKI